MGAEQAEQAGQIAARVEQFLNELRCDLGVWASLLRVVDSSSRRVQLVIALDVEPGTAAAVRAAIPQRTKGDGT